MTEGGNIKRERERTFIDKCMYVIVGRVRFFSLLSLSSFLIKRLGASVVFGNAHALNAFQK